MQKYIKEIVFDKILRSLCRRPYPNHSKGCPNFGKRNTCPPQCPLLADVYDINKGFWIVWIEFDFAEHCKNMRKKHPDWSQRQVECCLYWQGTANKMLQNEIIRFKKKHWTSADKITMCPEAMGMNVTTTMKKIGVELEWPPKNIVRKVALVGRMK